MKNIFDCANRLPNSLVLETLDDEETFKCCIDEAIDYYNLRRFVGAKEYDY